MKNKLAWDIFEGFKLSSKQVHCDYLLEKNYYITIQCEETETENNGRVRFFQHRTPSLSYKYQ